MTAASPSVAPVDRETDAPWLTDDETDAWLGVIAIALQLPGMLDKRLQRDAGLGLFEYLSLSALSMADDRRLRMSELATLSNGSLSRLSNVVKRLEERGWVRREPDPADGRYTLAILTDAGWARVVAGAPGHVRAVRHFVLDPLSQAQVGQLRDIGRRIAGGIREGWSPTGSAQDTCPPVC